MLNFIASVVLASLLIPSGFNFLIDKAVDYSYVKSQNNDLAPKRIVNNSFGLKTTAKSILVVDQDSGAVLYDKNSEEIAPIASITKLVTALVILDTNPDWEQKVTITEADQLEGGIIYLLPGEEVTVKDLFNLMLIASANEAAAALARNSGIDNFNSAMNRKATEIGMTESYFSEPSGISAVNVSSANDLVKLAKVAFSKTEVVKAVTNPEYQFEILNNQRQVRAYSTNQLLGSFLNRDGYIINGAKTGYLNEAGYCMLFQVTKESGRSLIIAILGAETIIDRWQEAKGLVDWIYRNYSWLK